MPLEEWKTLFEMSDRHGFVIASDECYSEIYFSEKPLGALQAAQRLGRSDYRNLVVFSSLSKRSNVPGMRSGFVAGDADVHRKIRAVPHLSRLGDEPGDTGRQHRRME